MTPPAGIDPRGPRVAAWITSVLLLFATVLGLLEAARSSAAPGALFLSRATQPALLVTLFIAALFLWGLLSPRTHPWSLLFRTLVRPRLAPPRELEDPRPPRFAQAIGLIVVTIGLILELLGVPWALPIATAMAFVAAFLNAAFGLCLGCQLYLLLQRAGVLGRAPASSLK